MERISEKRVVFLPMNRTLTVPVGTPLPEAMRSTGISVEAICGGKGTCKKCRVILTKGKCAVVAQSGGTGLPAEDKDKGYYLACQVRVTEDCEFTIPVESRIHSPQILLSSTIKVDTISPTVIRYPVEVLQSVGFPSGRASIRLKGYAGPRPHVPERAYRELGSSNGPLVATLSLAPTPPELIDVGAAGNARPPYGVALDLGTTTVVGCLVDLQTGKIIDTASTLNRQITYGEELITRIGYASTPENLERISNAARESIDSVITSLARAAGIQKTDIVDMCLAGNTVMHHLFCGIDPGDLEMVNANVSRTPLIRKAGDLGLRLSDGAYVYCLPNVSRFVGGDVVGDILASGMQGSEDISLLVDLGTNGEIVIGNRDWAASVSCASGPAFEGSGIANGIRAMKGAIEHVDAEPETSGISYTTIGDAPPHGICGSGIIDAVTAMVSTRALDFAGKMRSSHPLVRSGHEGLEYVLVPAVNTGIGRDIVISQRDIDYLVDSKAAACGAISVLLKKYKLTVSDIKKVYLAGAFGAYTNMKNAMKLGVIPEFPAATFHPIGNGSLSGAYATLISRKHRTMAESIAREMAYTDLMVDSDFFEEYLAALYIPGKRELFPGFYSKTYQ